MNRDRFIFKLLYNGEDVASTDQRGNLWKAERDFNARMYEPKELGNNHLGEKKLVQDKDMNPHPYEEDLFENSWEIVECFDKIKELLRFVMRDGTHGYVSKVYPNNGAPKKDNIFTLVLIDTKSPLRNPSGGVQSSYDLDIQISKLKRKRKLSVEDRKELSRLRKEKELTYVEREIFRTDMLANDFSFDGTNYTPSINKIFYDFNIFFSSPSYHKRKKGNLNYADIKEYNNMSNKFSAQKRKRKTLKKSLQDMENIHDSIKIASIEKDIRGCDNEMYEIANTYFKGIYTLITEAMDKESYENRFVTPKAAMNTFATYSVDAVEFTS